jgi:hypothetical protein
MCRRLLILALALTWGSSASGEESPDASFDVIVDPQNAPTAVSSRGLALPGVSDMDRGPTVRLPLDRYARLRVEAIAKQQARSRRQGPAILYGEARYNGRAGPGGLALNLKLRLALGRPGRWKSVPLVGRDVVLTRAAVEGERGSIAVTTRGSYQVWVTRRTGDVTLDLDLLVPARGPRGSIEFDFVVPRTPVTLFSCTFPRDRGPRLQPRVDGAITSSIRPEGGGIRLSATLGPTTRIHLLGLRDLGDARSRRARVYAETLNLLSIGERVLEVFSVIRYTILYAGAREFRVLIPGRMTVLSVDGKGAFRYTLEQRPEGTLLVGETAFPIRNSYELSLRLRRESPAVSGSFQVPLPRCHGVERELGWLAVEVPGKLRLAEELRDQMLAVDVRQLPAELLRSAVSPILLSYRYHGKGRSLRLAKKSLPDHRAASESIDRARVFSVVSADGAVLTELRLTLRNRLRRSLTLKVPREVRVRSVLLDGRPSRPSRDRAGRLVLPLSRSRGATRLSSITVQVVLEDRVAGLRWVGTPELVLPAVNLPISSLAWTIYLPRSNIYSGLESDGSGEEPYSGQASWREPEPGRPGGSGGPPRMVTSAGETAHLVDAGALPVRIKLPRSGARLDLSRFWIEDSTPVTLSLRYMSRRLLYPLVFVLGLTLAIGVVLLGGRWASGRWRPRCWAGVIAVGLSCWPLYKLGGPTALAVSAAVGMAAAVVRWGWWRRAIDTIGRWAKTLPARFRERTVERAEPPPHWIRRVARVALSLCLLLACLVLAREALRLLLLLLNPLEG